MTAGLSVAQVLRLRLAAQRLTTPGLDSATAVVAHLGCVQSQEWAHGFWSLGMRTHGSERAGLSYSQVQAEFDAGAFVRTHVLRPTWHYVTPADLRWILALTSPRVQQRNAGTYRRLGLDDQLLRRTAVIMVEATTATPRTRAELGKIIGESGIRTGDGMWLAHVVMWAELEGLICSGPLRGAQHTYVPLGHRIDPNTEITPDDPLAELAWRFVRGRGPATAADLARWASLTLTDARTGLERAGDRLRTAEVQGQTLWWAADLEPGAEVDHDRVWWVPLYDELPLSHTAIGFPRVEAHPHRPGDDVFVGSLLADTAGHGPVDLGLWKRTIKGRTVELETRLPTGLDPRTREAVDSAGEHLTRFLRPSRDHRESG